MAQITYDNKVALYENSDIANINKVKAEDMNEIKTVVNTNATTLDNLVVNTNNPSNSNVYSCNYINNLLVIDSATSDSITIGAGGHVSTPIDISKTGYTPIGIVQVDTTNNTTSLGKFSFVGNNAYVNIINTTSSSQTTTVTVKILYLKS